MRTQITKNQANFYQIVFNAKNRAMFAELSKQESFTAVEINGKFYECFSQLRGYLTNVGFDELKTSTGKILCKFSFSLSYQTETGQIAKHIVTMFDSDKFAVSFYEKLCFLSDDELIKVLSNPISVSPYSFTDETGKHRCGLTIKLLPDIMCMNDDDRIGEIKNFHSKQNPLPVEPVTTKKGTKTIWNFEPVTAYYVECVENLKQRIRSILNS